MTFLELVDIDGLAVSVAILNQVVPFGLGAFRHEWTFAHSASNGSRIMQRSLQRSISFELFIPLFAYYGVSCAKQDK